VVSQFDSDSLRTGARLSGADAYFDKGDLQSLNRYVELLAQGLRE
jgi:hypothetical protein